MATVYLSRRNLETLQNKLDRNEETPGASKCTIIKRDTLHKKYPCSEEITVTAVEDEDYYHDRLPGEMWPGDAP